MLRCYHTFSHQTRWQRGTLPPHPHPPKEGHCEREVGGAGKAREDQPSSNPAATSPGPAARGADSSPGTVSAEPLRERSLLCPTVGRPPGCGPILHPLPNYPPALMELVEFVVGKAQGPEATWLKILKIKGRREQPPLLESSSAGRRQRGNSRQGTSLLCPSGVGREGTEPHAGLSTRAAGLA